MAGGKGGAFDNDILKLILNGVAIPYIADNAATTPLTNLYMSLHTADPGGGTQTTNEAAYTGYARVAVPRTPSGFLVSGSLATLAAAVFFPTPTGGSELETWCAVGAQATGSGRIFYHGPLIPNLAVTPGTPPQLTTGTTITES